MPSRAILAAAGSGKTDLIIDLAVEEPARRVLITTYTRSNLAEIRSRLVEKYGYIPAHIELMTWFEFLLRECVKPYQSFVTESGRIQSINFVTEMLRYRRRANIEEYYLDSASNVYSDAVSDLACVINERSSGYVVGRLERIFDLILIDEMQDLAGYDLELIRALLPSAISIVLVGDPRQAIYLTNRSNKNSQYRGAGISSWVESLQSEGLCEMETLAISHRCNPSICSLADSLYPNLPRTISGNLESNNHSGIFLVDEAELEAYHRKFSPAVLRWSRSQDTQGLEAMNFGDSKGLSYSRVLIFPTRPMIKYLESGSRLEPVSIAKFYVAVTRARHSVAFVTGSRGIERNVAIRWNSES